MRFVKVFFIGTRGGLLQSRSETPIAIDATTLEANAAMRSIVRRDTGASYEEFLRGLEGLGHRNADARRLGAAGSQAQEAHVE
jgi:hypothetical protein